MLYRPEAFELLTDEPWHEGRVRDAIAAIVADADAAFDPDALWPAHEWDGWNTPLPLKALYVGAAGVLWALDELRRRGYAATSLDLAAASRRTLELWRETPDLMRGVALPRQPQAALLEGETGILLVAHRLGGGEEHDVLAQRLRESTESEANELMWGAPGALVAAAAMWRWTGDERWAQAWREAADAVWAARDPDGLWTQQLYGEAYRGLGPVHGLVGNVLALLGGGRLLAADRARELRRDASPALARTAVESDGLANWPGAEGEDLVSADGQIRLQWCTGAAGVVASAADYLDGELLLAGAELVWRAGPHGAEKGAGLCHGTAGNGYALLKAFERTGEERWLERGRRFAVHALGQVLQARAERGRGRYSLWTGDPGVAVFAADCLDARTRYPLLEEGRSHT